MQPPYLMPPPPYMMPPGALPPGMVGPGHMGMGPRPVGGMGHHPMGPQFAPRPDHHPGMDLPPGTPTSPLQLCVQPCVCLLLSFALTLVLRRGGCQLLVRNLASLCYVR